MKTKPLISVAIYLKGYELDPDRVSRVLGIEPSRFQRKGGFRAGSTKFIAPIGMWAIKIDSKSRSISDVIDELLQKIGEPAMPLSEIEGVEDAHLDVFLAFHEADRAESVEFLLTKNQIAKLCRLGLSGCFTVA